MNEYKQKQQLVVKAIQAFHNIEDLREFLSPHYLDQYYRYTPENIDDHCFAYIRDDDYERRPHFFSHSDYLVRYSELRDDDREPFDVIKVYSPKIFRETFEAIE